LNEYNNNDPLDRPMSHAFFLVLYRIHKYASCSNECFVLALVYIDRLIQRNNFLLTELNVHRVVITAILLAAKFFDDAYYNNAYYAKVGGVLVSEMNGLEVDFLFRINFSLHVPPELFHKYRAELVSHSLSAGVSLPAMSASMHYHTRTPYHSDVVVNGGNVSRRSEPVHLQPMQTVTEEKRSVGAFITPSPPAMSARASAFPSDHPSYSYPVHQTVPCDYANGSVGGMDTDEQLNVVGNTGFPGHKHHHSAPPETGSLGKLLQQHYQASVPNGFHQSEPGNVQHFVAGHKMLTGVSGRM
jgi:hypothetical protein